MSRDLDSPMAPPRVAVLVSRFPRITETFILREIDELERQGQPVRLVPLIREKPPVVHPEAVPWIERALYTPWLSTAIVASVLRTVARRPGRTLATKLRLVAGTLRHPTVLLRTLVLFPKAIHLGERLTAEGVTHLHAHFATYPATVAWIVRRLFDLPFSFTVHAHDLFVHRALLRTKVRDADFVRSISRFNKSYLQRLYPEEVSPRGGLEKIPVIPMGLELGRYDPPGGDGPGEDTAVKDTEGRADEDEVEGDTPARILCVAALETYKGISVLLAACDTLAREGRRFVCDVVGEGSRRRALEREIRRRGLTDRVRLLGARPQSEVACRMRRVDLFVLPSVVAPDGQMEGLPVVLMEALASRLPVVATRLSGIPELVEDGLTGLLAEPGDAESLAQALRRLLDDRERHGGRLGDRMAAAGRRRVEEAFDVRCTAARLAARLARTTEPVPGSASPGSRILHAGPDAVVREELQRTGSSGVGERRVLKRPLERPGQSRPPRERATWEHEVLTRLHRAGMAVPRPLGLVEDGDGAPAVAMEPVRGEPLDALLRRQRWSLEAGFRELEAAVRATGGWLRRLQEVTDGGRHGDLWPGNVRVDPTDLERSGVVVLDLEGFAEGCSPYRDAAHFLVTSGLYLTLPLLGRRRRRLERAFVRGWRPTGLGPEEASELARETGREARRLLDRTGRAPEESILGGLGGRRRRRWLHRLARRAETDTGGTGS